MRNRTTKGTVVLAGVTTLGLAACSGGAGGPQSSGASKLSDDKVVIGLLNDQSGVYKDLAGPNSGVAINLAIEDYKAKYGDQAVAKNIEVIQADHQNKADVANTKAQEMYDRQKADIILDVPNSAAALAVATQAQAKKKVYINVGAGTMALTGDKCNKYTFHWAYNTEMLARGTAGPVTQEGGKTWAIVYPDYAFGQDMNKAYSEEVVRNGGRVLQSIASPFPSDNFAPFVTKASEGNPQVVAAMHAGGDLTNFVKAFNQSPLKGKAQLAVGLFGVYDIRSIGIADLGGVVYTDSWYWNFDETNKKFADRFKEKTDRRPAFGHAGVYSAALQYLEAIQATGTDNSDDVVKNLEGKKINDVYLRNAEVRAADHMVIHDIYLAKIKTTQGIDDWDVVDIQKTVPAAEAFPPPQASCKMNG